MKTKLVLILVCLLVLVGYSQTNTTPPAQEMQQVVQTNLNQVLIEVLAGVKDAGKEVYAASKSAITKSVDFVVEQAPDVVHQFMLWKITEHILDITKWLIVVFFLWFMAYKMHKAMKEEEEKHPSTDWFDEHSIPMPLLKWAIITFSVLVIYIGVIDNSKWLGKAVFAPKVYVLEYALEKIGVAK